MNYAQIYFQLIERSKNRHLEGYTERHHIIPRCMNGNEEDSNIAVLTAREHFIAHLLLVKIYPNNPKLIRAAVMMTMGHNDFPDGRINNRIYGWLREKFSKAQSESQKGSGNSNFGKRYKIICNSQGEQKRIPRNESIPSGWLAGTVFKNKKEKELERKSNRKERQLIQKLKRYNCSSEQEYRIYKMFHTKGRKISFFTEEQNKIGYSNEMYDLYDKIGFKKFVELTKYPFCQTGLTRYFEKYASNFISQESKPRGKIKCTEDFSQYIRFYERLMDL